LLEEWSVKGPVLLGPLDMGMLPYFFHSELFRGIDHYIVVMGVDEDIVWFSDPEAVPLATMSRDELVSAWRAEHVPEGRGAFVMRRIEGMYSPSIDRSLIDATIRFASANLL